MIMTPKKQMVMMTGYENANDLKITFFHNLLNNDLHFHNLLKKRI